MHQLQLTSPTKKATHQGSLICVLCKTTNTLNTLILLLGRAIVQSTKAFMQKIESGVVPGALRIFKAPQAAEALLTRGAGRVLVTDGGNPCAEGRAGQGVITATPRQVMVHRVTGAGDTFMAAHIVAERRGADRSAALHAALGAAADYISKEVGS